MLVEGCQPGYWKTETPKESVILDVKTIETAQKSCLKNGGIKSIKVNDNKEIVCVNGAVFRK